jgi:hypothetical protein
MHDHEKHNRLKWMSDDQWKCMQFLSYLFNGFHRIRSSRVKVLNTGISYRTCNVFSTFDCDHLTKLVLLAHKHCIRVTIIPSGSGYIKLGVWARRSREEERVCDSHPDLIDLIEMCNTLINREGEK